jgi:hypothetical protein
MRFYEDFNIERATEERKKIELRSEEMRKEEAKMKIEYKPKFFNFEIEDGKKVYKYSG